MHPPPPIPCGCPGRRRSRSCWGRGGSRGRGRSRGGCCFGVPSLCFVALLRLLLTRFLTRLGRLLRPSTLPLSPPFFVSPFGHRFVPLAITRPTLGPRSGPLDAIEHERMHLPPALYVWQGLHPAQPLCLGAVQVPSADICEARQRLGRGRKLSAGGLGGVHAVAQKTNTATKLPPQVHPYTTVKSFLTPEHGSPKPGVPAGAHTCTAAWGWIGVVWGGG